jgi:hypothetical protein
MKVEFDIDDRPIEERAPELVRKIAEMSQDEIFLSLREIGLVWNGSGFDYRPELDERKKQADA